MLSDLDCIDDYLKNFSVTEDTTLGPNIKVQFLIIQTIYFTSKAGRNGSICVCAKKRSVLRETNFLLLLGNI